MTAMDSGKSRVNNKKGKHWVYFSKPSKNSKSISNPAASTKPSGMADTALPHRPSNHFMKAHMKKQKRKGKLLNSAITDKDKREGSNEGGSASTISSEVTTKRANKKTDDYADKDNAHINTLNASKVKQQRKKRRRKLKILKRKEKEKNVKGSSGQNKLVPSGLQTKNSKRRSDQAESHKTSGVPADKELDRETSKDDKLRTTSDVKPGSDDKGLSRKRKRRDELNIKETKKKKKKKRRMGDTLDSGMSSGTDEAPEEPQGVASNWKALVSKLKASAPNKPKLKAKRRNTSDKAVSSEKDDEIWFDGVDPVLLEAEKGSSALVGSDSAGDSVGNNKITKCVALDCEMVGIGHEGKESILARVSMVNEYGQCIYDKFVKPREKVTDFRTEFSGVRPKDLFRGNAEEFLTVQKEVADIMKDKILVGHALKNDMKVLFLGHPRRLIRDTAAYPHFRELMKTKRPALKKLAKTVLGVTVQEGEHNSVEDAQTAMRLYTLHRTAWEKSLKQRGKTTKK